MQQDTNLDSNLTGNWKEMHEQIFAFPDLLSASLEKYNESPWTLKDYEGIAFAGMGGSSIGSMITKDIYDLNSKIPLIIIQNFNLPRWITRNWLLIGTSFSGNTYETNNVVRAAIERGIDVKIISSGGKLLELANRHNLDFFKLDKTIQKNNIQIQLQPRAALPMSIAPILKFLSEIESINFNAEQIYRELDSDRHLWNEENNTEDNYAKRFAKIIFTQIPIFLGYDATASVAYRAKCQINENAKYIAYNNVFPEFVHNEIESFGFDEVNKRILAIILSSKYSTVKNKRLVDVTKGILQEKINVFEYTNDKPDIFSEIFSMIMFWDFVSLYLSILNQKDPVTVNNIKVLKRNLKKILE